MDRDSSEEKSLKRAKDTTGEVLKLGLRACAVKFFSGHSLSLDDVGYSLLATLASNFGNFYKDNREERLKDFMKELGGETPEVAEEKVSNLKDEEIYNIVHHLLDDDESTKAKYYAKLLKYLAGPGKKLDDLTRSSLVKRFRELDGIDFETIEELIRFGLLSNFSEEKDSGTDYVKMVESRHKENPFKSSSLQKLDSMKIINVGSFVVDNDHVSSKIMIRTFAEILLETNELS